MTTQERQKQCEAAGYNLRRIQYLAGSSPFRAGWKWQVSSIKTGAIVVEGQNPAQAFKRWLEKQAKP